MSRSERAAARKRLHLLLIGTGILVAVVLVVLIILLIPKGPDNDEVQGNTDSSVPPVSSVLTDSANSVTDSSTGTDTAQNTDPVTDTASSSENTSVSTDNLPDTDSAESQTSTSSNSLSTAGTSTDKQEPTTNSSGSSDTGSEPGVNADGTFDFTSWNLILINPDHAIPENFSVDLKTISLNGYDRLVDARCADAFRDMVTAAKQEGIVLKLRSTYRGIALQTQGFNNKVQEYINKGYSKEEATKIAATIVAVPGTSEHHTGLAADITTPSYDRLNEGFENTDAFKWLYAHCAEYGFILRYPKDKTEITKIIYEPWHYRYVGKKAARIIMSEGICYEEFVEKYGNVSQ